MKLATFFLVLSLTVLTYGSTVSATKHDASTRHHRVGQRGDYADPDIDDYESDLSQDEEVPDSDDSSEDSDKPVTDTEEQSADEDDDQEKSGDPSYSWGFGRRRRYYMQLPSRRRRYWK